jgi:hypothetical protein
MPVDHRGRGRPRYPHGDQGAAPLRSECVWLCLGLLGKLDRKQPIFTGRCDLVQIQIVRKLDQRDRLSYTISRIE